MLLKNSDFWRIVAKDRLTVALVTVFCVLIGIFFEGLRTPAFQTITALIIAPEGQKETTDFNYDHYYSLEAIDSLTDSLEEWLKSPAVLSEAQLTSRSAFRSADWRFWEKNNWKIRKKAPQLIEVVFYTQTESEAKRVENVLKKETEQYLESFNRSGDPHFSLTNPTFALESKVPRYAFIISLSFIWGIILGGLLAIERENLRRERRRNLLPRQEK